MANGDTLHDLIVQGWTAVLCECQLCFNRFALPLAWLGDTFGMDKHLPQLKKRFTCSNCRGRHVTAKPEYRIVHHHIVMRKKNGEAR